MTLHTSARKIPGWMYFEKAAVYHYQSGRRIHLVLDDEIEFVSKYATEFTLCLWLMNGNPHAELYVTRYKE